MSHGVLQLDLLSTGSAPSPDELARLQQEFRSRHHVVLPQLLSPALARTVTRQLRSGQFADANYQQVGHDLRMAPNGALDGLHLAVNDPLFLQMIERITESEQLDGFWGRIYRMLPDAGHEADWHDDLFADRHIGLSINLSEQLYEGGLFEMRELGRTDLLGRVHNTGLGDAILFRLSPQLQHRVTALGGKHPKTAFAGWFRAPPS